MKNVEKFINELGRVGRSINTLFAYGTDLKQFKVWLYTTYTTDINTDNITKLDIKHYVKYMNDDSKWTENTINRKIKAIVQYTKYLNNSDICNTIVNTYEFEQNSDDNVKFKTIDKKDLYKLKMTMYASENKRDIAIFEILSNIGLRCNEIINIEIDDIRSSTDVNSKNSYQYLELKACKKSMNRLIPLNKDVVTAITEYIKVRPLNCNNKLLQGQRGPITRIAINKLLENYCKKSIIESVSPSMFRHTLLNNMLEEGIDFKKIGELLGCSISSDLVSRYPASINVEDK